MKFVNPYELTKDKISSLENWILVHSVIYYELNANITTDFKYDMNCKLLVDLIDQNPKAFKKSRYYETFKGFDGSGGSDLIYKLSGEDKNEIFERAMKAIRVNQAMKGDQFYE